MKKSLSILLGIVACSSACAPVYAPPPAAPAGYVVAVSDRPYYTHGPYYFWGGARYVWVPGHWSHRHGRRAWVHGVYVAR